MKGRRRLRRSLATVVCTVLALPVPVVAQAPSGTGSVARFPPAEAAAAARAAERQSNADAAEGLELRVWAPPGLVANPLTLDLDAAGNAFVIASARSGMLLDIRQHPDWVPEAHSLRTTEDLRAFFRRVMAPERSAENEWLPDFNGDGSRDYRDLTVVAEQVFEVTDTDGDGVADRSRVVHEGFNDDIVSDIAGGILLRDDDLFVTAAPDLWRLRDTTGDGIYDEKTSLSHGYSIHPAFSGHDMSALALGPDGRLYWKIGDIGLNIVDETGRRWAYPNQGAILRAEPDGSHFEVFAAGLRNTQEIAFDKYGNLISVDNDGDHAGETERVVYIVQGSDAGWRSTWQYGKYTDARNNGYNVWMEEGLFRPQFEGQAAYITPPIAPYHAGPSGFAYNPGTALGRRWADHFFISSFTGSASNANVFAFRLEPEGAGFTLAGDTRIVSGLLSAGIAFGADGALYLTDWIQGWGATGEGLLWRLDVTGDDPGEARRDVQSRLSEDFGDLRRRELQDLLAHADMRVRERAQFELVQREDTGTLADVAEAGHDQLARFHALWGLGQLARAGSAEADTIRPYLADADPEIRAQAAKLLGDVRDADSTGVLIDRLTDEAPRVRFYAAEALGRIGAPTAVGPIAAMLAANDNEDVYLRTAGVHALASIGDAASLESLANHASSAVRVAAVVALRRMRDPRVAAFVDDSDPYVVTEAARAINDEGGIVPALPALAAALDGPVRNEAFVRRAISANLRVGDGSAAHRLAAFAARDAESQAMRIEAVDVLGIWARPSNLDRVDGAWLGQLDSRDTGSARLAVADLLPLLESADSAPDLKVAILASAVALDVEETRRFALARLEQDDSAVVRIESLAALRELGGTEAMSAIELALDDPDADVRMAAIEAMPGMPIPDVAKADELETVIVSASSLGERQSAMAALGAMDTEEAGTVLVGLLGGVTSGLVPPALQLDLLEAAARNASPAVLARLDALGVGRDLQSLAEALPEALENGGAALRGRQLVLRHPTAQCVRCHTLGASESTVGPALDGIGGRLSRAELLESLLDPNAALAEGFAVESASAMPPMGALLSYREIRDVIEFLASER